MIIILPVRNEEKNIKNIVHNFDLWKPDKYCKIIFIDDGSTDNTEKTVRTYKRQDISYIKNSFDRGKGSALKTAYILITHNRNIDNNELIVFLDGDGQIDFKNINILLNTMNLYCADVVVGNKRHAYSHTNYSFFRSVVSRTYNFIIKILFGLNYSDTQCGIKMFRKYALDKIIDKINIKRYAFDVELFVALKAQGYILADAPIQSLKQRNKGSVSFGSIWVTFVDTLLIWGRAIRGYYK